MAVLHELLGPDLRLHGSKLNMKAAHYGSPVEWHQDWAFYPHTNDDILAIGVMLDDMDLENGPLMVVPGSHKGPVWNHHGEDGRFAGLVDPADIQAEIASAVALTGRAGTMSFHHVRALHGSALNTSDRSRNLLLYEVAASDAWPLLGVADFDDFNRRLLTGRPSIEPRVTVGPGAPAAAAGGPPGLDLREPVDLDAQLLPESRGLAGQPRVTAPSISHRGAQQCGDGGGTSRAGLRSKNPVGLSMKPIAITGITGQSSGRTM